MLPEKPQTARQAGRTVGQTKPIDSLPKHLRTVPVYSLTEEGLKNSDTLPDIRPPTGGVNESVSWNNSPRGSLPTVPLSQKPLASSMHSMSSMSKTLPVAMEQFLARELQLIDNSDPIALLLPHKEVLHMFSSAFPSFSGVLSKIIAAYDTALGMEVKMETRRRSGGSEPPNLHFSCKEEISDLQTQIVDLQRQLAAANSNGGTKSIEGGMKHKYLEAKKRLETQVEAYQGRLASYEESQKEDLERMLTLIRTAKASECRVRAVDLELRQQKAELEKMNALTRMLRSLEKELRELRHTYSQTVPLSVHQAIKTDLEKSLSNKESELRMMRRLCALRATERDTVISKFEALEERLEMKDRPLTPRPNWSAILSDYPSVRDAAYPVAIDPEGTTSQVITSGFESTAQMIRVLLSRIQELEGQVQDWRKSGFSAEEVTVDLGSPLVTQASQRGNSITQSNRSMLMSNSSRFGASTVGQYVLAYGDSPTVPPFLRMWGLVRRLPFSLTNVRQLIVRLFESHIKSNVDWKDPNVRIAFELHNFIPELIKALPSLQTVAAPAIPFAVGSQSTRGRSISQGTLGVPKVAYPTFNASQLRGTSAFPSPPVISPLLSDPITFGYSFFLAAKDYSHRCPLCSWFIRCLEGSMPPAIVFAAMDVFKAAREDVVALAELHGRSSIKRGPLMESLGSVFITKTMEELDDIRLALGEEASIDVTQIVNFSHPFTVTLILQDCNAGMKLHMAVVEGLTSAAIPKKCIHRTKGKALPSQEEEMGLGDEEDDATSRRPKPTDLVKPLPPWVDEETLMIEVGDVRKVILSLEPRCPEAILARAVRDPFLNEYPCEGSFMPLKTILDNIYGLGLSRFTPASRETQSSSRSASASTTPTSLLPMATGSNIPPRASLSTPSVVHLPTPPIPTSRTNQSNGGAFPTLE